MPHVQGKLTLFALRLRGLGVSRPTSHRSLCLEIVLYAVAYEIVSDGQMDIGIAVLLLLDGYQSVRDVLLWCNAH